MRRWTLWTSLTIAVLVLFWFATPTSARVAAWKDLAQTITGAWIFSTTTNQTIERKDANGGVTPLVLRNNPATAAAADAVALNLSIENSAQAVITGAEVWAVSTDVTAASEDVRLAFYTRAAGSVVEAARLDSTGLSGPAGGALALPSGLSGPPLGTPNLEFAMPTRWTSVAAATSRVPTGTDNKTIRPRHRLFTTSSTSDTPSTWTAGEITDVMPILLDTTGPGVITAMKFAASQGTGANWAMLSYLRIQVFHDAEAVLEAATPESGRPCVDAPLGLFMGQPGKFGSIFSYQNFAAATGSNDSGAWDDDLNSIHDGRTQLNTYHSRFFDATSGFMVNHFTQPFGSRVLVRVKNDCEHDCTPIGLYYQIEYAKGAHGSPYRFHAKYKQVFPATSGSSMVVTPTISGAGQFLGIIGTTHSRNQQTYEGDVFVRVDGQAQESASLIYSGNEEFWHGGYYWDRGVEAGDFSGTLTQLAINEAVYRAEVYHGYRFFPTPIPFATSFQVDINHGDDDIGGLNAVVPVYWGGVSFWYQIEPCAAVTMPPFRPAADSSNYTSGRIPPGFTNPTNTELPAAGAVLLSPEAGLYPNDNTVVQNGANFSGNVVVWDADRLSPSGSDAYGGGILEIPFTDGSGGDDFVIFVMWVPAPVGGGTNKLDLYYSKRTTGGIFNAYISDNSACSSFRLLTLSSGSQDTYVAGTPVIGDQIGVATYNVADFAIGANGELVCIKLQMNGKNASSTNFHLVPDLFVIRP